MRHGHGAATFASEKKEIYVSPNGSDNSEGDIGSPLATLAAAKEKAKKLGSGATVYFREGTYTISETVRFDKSDSSNVKYKAFNDERVVFTSGVPYTGFEECTVNGVRAFKKDIGKDANFNILFNEQEAFTKTRYPESGYLRVKEVSDSDVMPEADGSDHYFAPLNECTPKQAKSVNSKIRPTSPSEFCISGRMRCCPCHHLTAKAATSNSTNTQA